MFLKNKKITGISITTFMNIAILSFLLFPISSNSKKTTAFALPVEIGTLFSIQHVESPTIVYVSGESLTLAQEAGRTIYNVIDIPPIIPNGDVAEPNGPIHPGINQKYYIATSTEPIITGKNILTNDISSFLIALRYLENEIDYYLPLASEELKRNTVLSFLRCINKQYDNGVTSGFDEFAVVCGPQNTAFLSDILSLNPGGMKIHEYFASFVSAEKYNSIDYGPCGETYLSNEYNLLTHIGNNEIYIDVIHMFASIDGIAIGTGAITGYPPYNLMATNSFRHLVSWAGDLQQSCRKLTNDIIQNNFSFLTILNNPSSDFDYLDYYADLDAQNIATSLNLNTCDLFSNILETYYNNLNLWNSPYNRKTMFVNNLASMVSGTATAQQKVQTLIYEFLKLNTDGTDLANNFLPIVDESKYHILGFGTSSFPSNTIRNATAEAFYEYLIA